MATHHKWKRRHMAESSHLPPWTIERLLASVKPALACMLGVKPCYTVLEVISYQRFYCTVVVCSYCRYVIHIFAVEYQDQSITTVVPYIILQCMQMIILHTQVPSYKVKYTLDLCKGQELYYDFHLHMEFCDLVCSLA